MDVAARVVAADFPDEWRGRLDGSLKQTLALVEHRTGQASGELARPRSGATSPTEIPGGRRPAHRPGRDGPAGHGRGVVGARDAGAAHGDRGDGGQVPGATRVELPGKMSLYRRWMRRSPAASRPILCSRSAGGGRGWMVAGSARAVSMARARRSGYAAASPSPCRSASRSRCCFSHDGPEDSRSDIGSASRCRHLGGG